MAESQTTVNLGETDVKIVTPDLFDSDHLKYGDITTNAVGLKEMYLNYGDGNLYFQTPRMYCPYGLGINELPEKDGKPAGKTYRLSLSFKGYDDASNKMVSSMVDLCKCKQAYLCGNPKSSKKCFKMSTHRASLSPSFSN